MEDVAKRLPQLSQRTDLQPAFSECRISSLLLASVCKKSVCRIYVKMEFNENDPGNSDLQCIIWSPDVYSVMGTGDTGHGRQRIHDPVFGKALRFLAFIDFAVKFHVGPLQKRYTGSHFRLRNRPPVKQI